MVARGLRHEGLRVDTCVRRGDPSAEIIVAAAELQADLVVMTTHGQGGLARAFLGSVAQEVVATSPVPVLLLRPGGHLMTRMGVILVPVDGSLGGALALASAVPLARSVGARVVLLDVAVPFVAYMTTSGSGFGDGALYFDENWDAEALEAANRYVSGLAARLQHAGIQAEGRAITGAAQQPSTSVAEAIMQTADDSRRRPDRDEHPCADRPGPGTARQRRGHGGTQLAPRRCSCRDAAHREIQRKRTERTGTPSALHGSPSTSGSSASYVAAC